MVLQQPKRILLLLTFLLVFSNGCCSFNFNSLIASLSHQEVEILPEPMTNQRLSFDPRLAGRHPQRVLMVATGKSNGSYSTQQKLITELASQFRQLRMFEVVAPSNVRMKSYSNSIAEGKFDERELSKLARDYNADAVAIVHVNEFRSSAPIRIGLSVAVVDSAETVIMAASDSTWDLADPVLRKHFDIYTKESLSAAAIEKPLLHHSPQAVFRFVASNVAHELRQSGL